MQTNEEFAQHLFSILKGIAAGVDRSNESAARFHEYKNAVLAEKEQEREDRMEQIREITGTYETKVTTTPDDQVRAVEATKY